MPWDVIIFYMLATICVLCAGGVVVVNNPVHSAIFLVLCFFNVAGIFLMLGAEFLAVVQLIVYTGAILVLVERGEIGREPLGQHRKNLRAGVDRCRVVRGVLIDGRIAFHQRVDVGNRDKDLHRAAGRGLADRELIEVA